MWFKFNNLVLVLGIAVTFSSSMANRIETKSHNVLRANSTFGEVTKEKVVRENFSDPSPILNKLNPMFP